MVMLASYESCQHYLSYDEAGLQQTPGFNKGFADGCYKCTSAVSSASVILPTI